MQKIPDRLEINMWLGESLIHLKATRNIKISFWDIKEMNINSMDYKKKDVEELILEAKRLLEERNKLRDSEDRDTKLRE